MTDNEKRAHDLTVGIMPILYQLTLDNLEPGGKIELYKVYFNAYNAALEEMNRDFPEGKKPCRIKTYR